MLVKNISGKTMKVRVQGEEMNIIQSNTIQTTLDKANELVANYPGCFEIIKDADAYVQDIVDGGGAGTSGLEQRVEALETEVDNKVDKEEGKGLSTNDYTDADKTAVEDIANKVDKENGKGLSTNDFSDAYKASLDLLSDNLDSKLNKDRGTGNAGKYLQVGADGNVVETSIEISDLDDVETTNPTEGQILSYNETSEKWENKELIIDQEFADLMDKTGFGKFGIKMNYNRGFLRQGRKPKKVIVFGNSMCAHGPRTDINYTVYDYREMAASKPNTGRVSIIYAYLKKLYPDIKMRKGNGAVWERQTNGSKSYATGLGNQAVYEMNDDGQTKLEDKTIDDILTENPDIDIIINQLYENITAPANTFAEMKKVCDDYGNLYDSLREKCPNAFLYQFGGFWQNYTKHKAVVTACNNKRVEFCYNPNLNPRNVGISGKNHSDFEIQTGDKLYDAEGNEICTVSSSVAGHPNDIGFSTMAKTIVNRLFNSFGFFESDKRFPLCHMSSGRTDTEEWWRSFESVSENVEIFRNFGNGTVASGYYNEGMKYLSIAGVYPVTAKVEGLVANHGLFKTEVKGYSYGYQSMQQTYETLNSPYYYRRGVGLSADSTNFTSWVCSRDWVVDGVTYTNKWYNGSRIKIKRFTISSDTVITNNTWTKIGSLTASRVIDYKWLKPLASGVALNDNISPYNWAMAYPKGIRLRVESGNIVAARNDSTDSATTSETIPANTVLYVEYV